MKPNEKYDHVFVIIRVDLFQGPDVAPEDKITVTKAFWDAEAARREAERLNRQRPNDRAHYFFKLARLERSGAPVGAHAVPVSAAVNQDGAENSLDPSVTSTLQQDPPGR